MNTITENTQNSLRVARYSRFSTVLGPGQRGVLWLQGCLQNCPGCVSPENRPLDGGGWLAVSELVEIFANCKDLEGLTFSGGEPMLQAEGLVALISELNEIRPFIILGGGRIRESTCAGSVRKNQRARYRTERCGSLHCEYVKVGERRDFHVRFQ